ncbi:MAG: ABC transporter permease [Candidatus Aegiribacteria sp.]|nr:ABC transporter permease [Candidatus Aegiribacteria sp.]
MKTIMTIFRKELKDSLRDRRTIITMIIVPLLMFPVMIGLTSRFIMSHEAKAQVRELKVGVFAGENAVEFVEMLHEQENILVFEQIHLEEGQELIASDSLDAFIVFHEEFDRQVSELGQGEITFYLKGTEEREIEEYRIMELLVEYEELLRTDRFDELNLDISIIETISVSKVNLATQKEQLADMVGGILPYMFILFCFMGSMYPSIDLAAGEKERGTLETLLTSPVNRLQILIGKFGVVVLTGISSAAVSLLGLYLGVRYVSSIPAEFVDMVMSILEPGSILVLLSLLLPLSVFFAGLLLSISFTAKSYKEAQSKIGPLFPVIIIPAFIGMMPGMNLNASTALIPILNVSLATRTIIAGQADISIMIIVYLSLAVYAGAALLLCSRTFSRESAILQ